MVRVWRHHNILTGNALETSFKVAFEIVITRSHPVKDSIRHRDRATSPGRTTPLGFRHDVSIATDESEVGFHTTPHTHASVDGGFKKDNFRRTAGGLELLVMAVLVRNWNKKRGMLAVFIQPFAYLTLTYQTKQSFHTRCNRDIFLLFI